MQDDLCVVIVGNIRKPVGKRHCIVLVPEARHIQPNGEVLRIELNVIPNNLFVFLHHALAFAARLIDRLSCLVTSRGTIRADIW